MKRSSLFKFFNGLVADLFGLLVLSSLLTSLFCVPFVFCTSRQVPPFVVGLAWVGLLFGILTVINILIVMLVLLTEFFRK